MWIRLEGLLTSLINEMDDSDHGNSFEDGIYLMVIMVIHTYIHCTHRNRHLFNGGGGKKKKNERSTPSAIRHCSCMCMMGRRAETHVHGLVYGVPPGPVRSDYEIYGRWRWWRYYCLTGAGDSDRQTDRPWVETDKWVLFITKSTSLGPNQQQQQPT